MDATRAGHFFRNTRKSFVVSEFGIYVAKLGDQGEWAKTKKSRMMPT